MNYDTRVFYYVETERRGHHQKLYFICPFAIKIWKKNTFTNSSRISLLAFLFFSVLRY